MKREAHVANLPVTTSVLAAALRLPEGTVIRNVVMDSQREGQVLIIVEHPELPLCREGALLVEMRLEFKNDSKLGRWIP